jgi:hypothetical protein
MMDGNYNNNNNNNHQITSEEEFLHHHHNHPVPTIYMSETYGVGRVVWVGIVVKMVKVVGKVFIKKTVTGGR